MNHVHLVIILGKDQLCLECTIGIIKMGSAKIKYSSMTQSKTFTHSALHQKENALCPYGADCSLEGEVVASPNFWGYVEQTE